MLLSEVIQYKNLPLIAQKAMEGFITGLHNSPFHGFSVEFSEHRAYNPGESIRNLDWKLLAKTEKNYIKQFNEETNLKCHLWLDVSKSMQYPAPNLDKLKFEILASSSIAYICTNQRDAFSFSLFSEAQISWKSEMKSTISHFRNCLSQLSPYWEDEIPPVPESTIGISELAATVKRRNLVVIFSDLLWDNTQQKEEAQFWETISILQFQKCEVLLVHVAHEETEINLNLGAIPIKFIDLESNEILKLQPEEIQELYSKSQNEQRKELENKSLQLGISYFYANVTKPIHEVLMEFYVKRSKIL